jgi:hypothetical protein
MKHNTLVASVALFGLFVGVLVYSRFVNLGWGLPYPMHPDERNMVVAILQMDCDPQGRVGALDGWLECFNPHFFAYGQFPLFIALAISRAHQFVTGTFGESLLYENVTMALRLIAAVASVATGIVSYRIVLLLAPLLSGKKQGRPDDRFVVAGLSLLFVFVPGLIQSARFGTTESLLMFLYLCLIYGALLVYGGKLRLWQFSAISGALCGVALATKISALPFLAIPALALLSLHIPDWKGFTKHRKSVLVKNGLMLARLAGYGLGVLLLAGLLAVVLSPYNVIRYPDFRSSMQYESGIGFGTILAFYTRSFFDTLPVLFPFSRILPFVFGVPMLALFLAGFAMLPWKTRETALLRMAILLSFVPQAFFYAKWTRFIAPMYPVAAVIAVAFLYMVYARASARWAAQARLVRGVLALVVFVTILPGLAFLSVYVRPDIRYTASEWIYKNVPENAYLLAETANVVDIPIPVPPDTIPERNYTYISFDFYHIDENPFLAEELRGHIERADYIIVNSRRVFENHTCLDPDDPPTGALLSIDQTLPVPAFGPDRCASFAATYPRLERYYDALFSGELGFDRVATFESYPELRLFGVPLLEFPDEEAEETWTVFDHPVIRIYKRRGE